MDEVVYIYDPSYLGDRNGMTSVQGQLRPKKKKKQLVRSYLKEKLDIMMHACNPNM
jgi:hypothetical protein